MGKPEPSDPAAWRLGKVLAACADYFARRGWENPLREAQWLVSELLGVSRLDLYLKLEQPLTEEERRRIRDGLKRRGAGEPLAYIVGVQPFRGLRIQVDASVLIPRPETEQLLDVLWRFLPQRRPLRLLDLATGSGCIAAAAAYERAEASVIASDISEAALSVARRNFDMLGLSSRIQTRQGDLFAALPDGCPPFDAILSNPPYVADSFPLDTSVASFEPATALRGGSDGLSLVRRILREAPERLLPGGLLVMEIGFDQADELRRRWDALTSLRLETITPDFAGIERFVVAFRNES